MFYSEALLSREGPLAHVWLAANLERRLSKNQLLGTNIQKSVGAIVDAEAALRLSGTLLFGVVRIYSRKAKYLLDDCNDALLKLKMIFKPGKNIELPTEKTISNLTALTLPNTITEFDLLLPEPLDLDADITSTNQQQTSAADRAKISLPDLDASIEIPRAFEEHDDLAGFRDTEDFELDLGLDDELQEDKAPKGDMELDLDLDLDNSVEVGRAGTSPIPEEPSDLVMGSSPAPETGGDYDFDLGPATPEPVEQEQPISPLTPVGDIEVEHLPLTPAESPKRPRVSATRKPGKKRLMIDEATELDGSFIKQLQQDRSQILKKYPHLSVYQYSQTNLDFNQLSSNPEEFFRLVNQPPSFIENKAGNDLLNPDNVLACLARKKRRISKDDEIEQIPSPVGELDHETAEPGTEDAQETFVTNESNQDKDYDQGFDLGGFEEDIIVEGDPEKEATAEFVSSPHNDEEEEEESSSNGISKNTLRVAGLLRDEFALKESTSLDSILERQFTSNDIAKPNTKKQAVKTFFELLVLATGDGISLQQEDTFEEIKIESRQKLFEKFVV